jgi:hypothetical protein
VNPALQDERGNPGGVGGEDPERNPDESIEPGRIRDGADAKRPEIVGAFGGCLPGGKSR